MKKGILVILLLIIIGATALFILPSSPSHDTDISKAPQKSPAQQLAESLSLEEKVGQMFIVCAGGNSINSEDITTYAPGGYILFADFFQSRNKESVSNDIAAFQESSSIPMFIAVDEEGGSVVRVSKFPAYRNTPFKSPMELYQEGGLSKILEDTSEKNDLLLSMGINVNLAPVCDITKDSRSYIYTRTLGQDAETTSEYIAAVVKSMNRSGIGSALKHFPGYGNNINTHTGIATDSRSYEDFKNQDFLPFKAGIDAGAPCVLVNHNIVTCMDPENPATLSPAVHKILREELNFDGVIMTDDLSMDGAQNFQKEDNIAVAAIKAGNDLVCTNTSAYKEQIPAVINAVKNGDITEKQITDSVIRILQWKYELGLLK